MKEVIEGPDGSTLYDNSVVFISSDISDGNRHNSDNKPVIVGGRGGGFLNTGQHVAYPSGRGTPREKVSNLLVTTLAAAGVQSALGDSDKPLLTELVT